MRTPYSLFGSYYTITDMSGEIKLRSISGNAYVKDIFTIQVLDGNENIPVKIHRDGTLLHMETDQGHVTVAFETCSCLRLKGSSITLKLFCPKEVPYGCCCEIEQNRWLLTKADSGVSIILEAIRGILSVNCPWDGANSPNYNISIRAEQNDTFELAIELYRKGYRHNVKHSISFDQCASITNASFQEFLDKTVSLSDDYAEQREEAAYLNWSSVVSAEGLLKRPGMYMSKNWMCNVWSWDHCFNALALSYKNPSLAWDQYMVMFDAQDETGMLPDCINNSNAVWQFCKPPIHGWTLRKILKNNNAFGNSHMLEAYGPLCRWTDWWFIYRDSDSDGMPEYHHGNDSGWDNGTVFKSGVPVESPDLAAFLIIQMDVLSEIAAKLGNVHDASVWEHRADKLMAGFMNHFVKVDGTLVARLPKTHAEVECNSLLPYIALVLGSRLPVDIRQGMLDKVKSHGFVTQYGFATESIFSPLYEDDGYWRGPIWAPSTLLMVDGLCACGEDKMATETALKFIEMCSQHGFAENFDAKSGKGLRDPAYTWTSSVFLVLASSYLGKDDE